MVIPAGLQSARALLQQVEVCGFGFDDAVADLEGARFELKTFQLGQKADIPALGGGSIPAPRLEGSQTLIQWREGRANSKSTLAGPDGAGQVCLILLPA